MDKKKKNILIGGLLAVVLLLAVGYAAFATNLTINGTSSIDSRWDVHIKDNGVSVKSSTMATNVNAQKDSQLTASFECELTDPGVSTISYDIIVENSGTFGAKLSSINLTGTTDYIDATTEGIEVGDVIAADGGTDTLTVTVSYKNVNTVPTGEDATANITVTLNYIQDDGTGGSSSLAIDSTFVPQYYRYGYGIPAVIYGDTATPDSWTTDPTTLNRDYYIGQDVDAQGKVSANYACFIINNTQYCMRGLDGPGGTNYYTQNRALLNTLKSAGIIACTAWNEYGAECSGGTLGYLGINQNGIATAGTSNSVHCSADFNGYSRCFE